MDENKQISELLAQIERNSRRQARFAALQCLLTLAAAIFCCAGFFLILKLLPHAAQILGQMQTVLTNLETTTQQLSQIDLSGMVNDMDALMTTAQEGLNQTFGKLETVDFATLNKAIKDLAAVVEPLSRVVKAFS